MSNPIIEDTKKEHNHIIFFLMQEKKHKIYSYALKQIQDFLTIKNGKKKAPFNPFPPITNLTVSYP